MSARSATQRSPRPTSQTRPVPPGRVRGSRPAAISAAADERGGAALGAARAPARRAARAASRRPRPVRGEPGVQPRTDRCPRPGRRPRGRRAGTTAVLRPARSSDPTAALDSSCRASPHTPHPDGGVPSRISTSTAVRSPRGCRSAADGPRRRVANGRSARRAGSSAVRRTARRRSDASTPVLGTDNPASRRRRTRVRHAVWRRIAPTVPLTRRGASTGSRPAPRHNGGVHPGDDQQRLIGGRYRLSAQLGSGAMGTVWSGYDEVLRRRVAVKELKVPPGVPAAARRCDLRERMLREARALGGLSHPNVITVYDVVDRRRRADGRAGDGAVAQPRDADLRAGRADDGPGRGRRVRHGGRRCARRTGPGITHRDVKPGNVLVADDGQVKLTDFGIARNVADAPMTTRRPRARLARLHRARGGGGPARHARGRPVGARRHAVRRGRGPPALRRARRPRLDDHRGGRRRGAAADAGRARSPTSSPRSWSRTRPSGCRSGEVRRRLRPLIGDPDDPLYPGSPDAPTMAADLPSHPGAARGSGGPARRPAVGPAGTSAHRAAPAPLPAPPAVGRRPARRLPRPAARGCAPARRRRRLRGPASAPSPAPERAVDPAPDEVQTEIRRPARAVRPGAAAGLVAAGAAVVLAGLAAAGRRRGRVGPVAADHA